MHQESVRTNRQARTCVGDNVDPDDGDNSSDDGDKDDDGYVDDDKDGNVDDGDSTKGIREKMTRPLLQPWIMLLT